MQLVITTPGTSITQKDECFRLKNGENQSDRSPLKVESIVISNKAMISSAAIVLALEHNIDVIFLDSYGDPVGRVWFSKLGSTAMIRRRQVEAAMGHLGAELVLDMIRQKLENQVRFLKKLMHARPGKEDLFEKAIATIEGSGAKLPKGAENAGVIRNSVMGLEGTAGAAYFGILSKLMPERYQFRGRSKRPAKDPFNAALNYCYGILYGRVEKACILAGLDSYVGFLHTDNYNKTSLVFDLIEPFRIFGEQTAVHLFTGRKMKEEFFDIKEGDVRLNDKGKPVLIDAMNIHLEESVRYRNKNVKRKYIIQHEAHQMANILLEADGELKRPEWLEIVEF